MSGLGALFVQMAASGGSGQPSAVSDEAARPVVFKTCSDCLDLTPHYVLDGYCECVICGTQIHREEA